MPIVPIAMALAQLAPSLLKIFNAGEPSVAVAERVVSIAQEVTGTSSPEAALDRLQRDTEAQLVFDAKIREQQVELEKAYLADIQNARQREVTISSADNAPLLNKVISPILALIVVIGGGCLTAFSANADVRMAAVSVITLVLGYYFGTSQGSTKANQMLRDIVRKEVP